VLLYLAFRDSVGENEVIDVQCSSVFSSPMENIVFPVFKMFVAGRVD